MSEIESGNSISVLFGKIKKWLSDLNSGAAEKLLGEKLSANRALISDENGNVNASDTVTKTEIERLSGVSSNIQDQLNSLNGKTEVNADGNGKIIGVINNKICTLYIKKYISADGSNYGTLPSNLTPINDVVSPVFISGYGEALLAIYTNGMFRLYTADYSEYLNNKEITGTVSYNI